MSRKWTRVLVFVALCWAQYEYGGRVNDWCTQHVPGWGEGRDAGYEDGR